MRDALANIIEAAGLGMVVAGVLMLAGLGVALVVAGVALVAVAVGVERSGSSSA